MHQALNNPKAAVTLGQLRQETDGPLKLLETAEQRKRRLQGNQDADGQLVKRLQQQKEPSRRQAAGMAVAPRALAVAAGVEALLPGLATGVWRPAKGGMIRPAAADVDEEVGEDEEGDEGLMSGEESGEEAR